MKTKGKVETTEHKKYRK